MQVNGEVIVYTSKGCPYCEQVIAFLHEHRMKVDERNISENEGHFSEWKSINPIGTPLTLYGEHQVIGFHKKNLQSIVEEHVGK